MPFCPVWLAGFARFPCARGDLGGARQRPSRRRPGRPTRPFWRDDRPHGADEELSRRVRRLLRRRLSLGPGALQDRRPHVGQDLAVALDRLDLLRNDAGRVLLPDGPIPGSPGPLHGRVGALPGLSHVAVPGGFSAAPCRRRREEATPLAGPPLASPVRPVPLHHAPGAGQYRRLGTDRSRAGSSSRPTCFPSSRKRSFAARRWPSAAAASCSDRWPPTIR